MVANGITTPELDRLHALMNFALNYYQGWLKIDGQEDNSVHHFFRSRGISQQVVDLFQVGYAVNGFDLFKKAARKSPFAFTYREMEHAGLINEKKNKNGFYDVYRGRIMVPFLHPVSGQCLGFAGRLLTDNTDKSDKDVFPRDICLYKLRNKLKVLRKDRFLFGLYQAGQSIKNKNEVFIVASYLDVLTLAQTGVTNVIASCGIPFTYKQAMLLKTYTDRIVLVYKEDDAGFRAAKQRVDVFLAAGIHVSIVPGPRTLESKEQIDLFLESLQSKRTDYILFKAKQVIKGKKTPQGFERAIQSIIRTINYIPTALRRDIYVTECAKLTGFSKEVLTGELDKQVIKKQEALEKKRRR